MQELEYKYQNELKLISKFENSLTCGLCSAALWPLDKFLTNQTIRTGLEWVSDEYCVKDKIYGGVPSVCHGAIKIMADSVLPSVEAGIFSPQRICDEHFGFCSNPHITELSAEAYVEKRLAAKPESTRDNQFLNNLYKKIAADPNPRPIKRSINLTDLHIDFHYKEGAATECNFPICCRDNGPGLIENW